MTFNMIKVITSGPIARIELNRPDKLNSLDESTMLEIHRAVDDIQADKQLRVLVITGAGRAFCAGQDLTDPAMRLVDGKQPDIGNLVERLFKPLVLKLQNLHMPTVAAVNGLAAGGGAALAFACDIVVATRSAYFLQAFSRIGLTPDTGSTWFLSNRLGSARAMGLTMLADKLPAAKAAEWGLIWDVIDDADFASAIDALAERLASMPTKALIRTRQLVQAASGHSLEQQLSMEATFIREMGWSKDYAEGVLAFSEKRQPNFTGE
ncbi:enoyl-CoA hydratase [Trinickia symbiotica]|uniref:2-(1,2-epoxy-1,2-dihydrophenyl)acetyl-CoA isomerase n=1 Tax=Trinickia symbiotica TaxID=863227 RepID=A0A2N7X9N3_9BURK|nr:enoyl-CoA hydratase-related protein [Trinickia symbiotica]PMS38438.1 2-(1,2-epoxy-1,2-dihydrophenyl)acetyl-CoA isomerase [Trinickia symbiotica]PPK46450.1 enoyl-CoA hydratase [Trinickia symbiotica]